MKHFFILLFVFYLLALLETSFFVHFGTGNAVPILLLLSVLAINLFEPYQKKTGFFAAGFAGFFWDIFSASHFCFHFLGLLFLAFFLKSVIKKWLRLPDLIFGK